MSLGPADQAAGDSNADAAQNLPPVVDVRRTSVGRDVLRATIQRIGSDKVVTREGDENRPEQPQSAAAAFDTGRKPSYTLPGMVRGHVAFMCGTT